MARLLFAALLLGCSALGCAGGSPLLHPAHVLSPDFVSVGAGLSGEMALARAAGGAGAGPDGPSVPANAGVSEFEALSVAPGVAPWVGARMGLEGSNEAGLTYTGRAVRLDGRHAFALGAPTLSVGLGAAALLAKRPGEEANASSAYGVGFDVPVLLGFQSTADLYAIWFGPRVGFELVRGSLDLPDQTPADAAPVDLSAQHLQLGLVAGVRAGFRHVHVALEVGAAYHRATGDVGGEELEVELVTLTPGGGLVITF